MKKFTMIEVLVWIAVFAIICSMAFTIWKGRSQMTVAPDGKIVYTVTIDGHQYLKSGDTLTHSAACPACQKAEK